MVSRHKKNKFTKIPFAIVLALSSSYYTENIEETNTKNNKNNNKIK